MYSIYAPIVRKNPRHLLGNALFLFGYRVRTPLYGPFWLQQFIFYLFFFKLKVLYGAVDNLRAIYLHRVTTVAVYIYYGISK